MNTTVRRTYAETYKTRVDAVADTSGPGAALLAVCTHFGESSPRSTRAEIVEYSSSRPRGGEHHEVIVKALPRPLLKFLASYYDSDDYPWLASLCTPAIPAKYFPK